MKTTGKVTLTLLSIVLLLGLVATGALAGERKADGTEPVGTSKANPGGTSTLGVGTITFDNNTPFNRDGTDGGTVGNLFDPALNPHSIATVSFALAGNYSTSVVMTVWDVNAGTAAVLQRQLISGASQSPNSAARFSAALTAPVVGNSGAFIAGIRNTDYDPCAGNTGLGSTCDGVALTNNVAPPVASRGARINFTSPSFVPTITGVASSGQALGATNAIFRVTGDNLPVELMSFSID
ncbi:MAG: hypothetical protein AAGD38_10565 [Acidobacteriota bacterium]